MARCLPFEHSSILYGTIQNSIGLILSHRQVAMQQHVAKVMPMCNCSSWGAVLKPSVQPDFMDAPQVSSLYVHPVAGAGGLQVLVAKSASHPDPSSLYVQSGGRSSLRAWKLERSFGLLTEGL